MTYDSLKDTAKSLDAARKAIRMQKIRAGEINPIVREVTIGNARLIQGDCLEVLQTLGKVDACNSDAVVYSQRHEKPAKRQHRPPSRGDENMGTAPSRNVGDVCEWAEVATGNGRTIRGDVSGLPTGAEAHGYSLEVEGEAWGQQPQLQARARGQNLPDDGGKELLRCLRCDGELVHPPQGRGPLQQHAEQFGSDVHELSFVNAQGGMVELPKGWAILTDPLME